MTPNIHGKMVYSFEQPMWHAITEPSTVPMTAVEVMEQRFGGGFEIFLRPLTFSMNGESVEEGLAIVRGSSPYEHKEVLFGFCSDRFHPLQPIDVAKCFDQYVKVPVETMGFFGKGERMFGTWKLPTIKVVKDEVQLYGTFSTGFDTLKGTKLLTAAVRTICWNTWTMAQGWADHNTDGNGKGNIWKGKAVDRNLLQKLGYWMEHVQENAKREAALVENFLVKLAKTPIDSDAEVHEILFTAYPPVGKLSEFYPEKLRTEKEEKIAEANEDAKLVRDGIYGLFAGNGTEITPDYWGLFNATTEFFCHVQPSKKPIAESVMVGNRAKNTMRMVETLSNRI